VFDPTEWHDAHLVEQALAPRGLPVSNSSELQRIVNLPRRPPVEAGSATAEALVELAQKKYSLGPRQCRCKEIDKDRSCITQLTWIQAWALHEMSVTGGLIANIFVGAGKSGLNILAPLAVPSCRLALLLVPSQLVVQIRDEYRMWAEHFRLPGLVVHMPGNKTWKSVAKPAPNGGVEPTLHVLAYAKLSGINSSDWIERLQPDLIIADEVDSIKDLTSARTMRVLRAFEVRESTRFCGWTGSLTDNSVKEFAHLSALALRYGSPLPVKKQVIDEWAQCLDAVPSPSPPGALIRLLNPDEGITDMRKAFRRRLVETPGFIAISGRQAITRADGSEVGIIVRERPAPPVPSIVNQALDLARDFCRPDTLGGAVDDEIMTDILEQARCVREIASGLFYKWSFLPVNGVPQKTEVVKAWYAARKAWNHELRHKMLRGEVQLDSPMLCENAARRAWGDAPSDSNLPEWRARHWTAWRDIMDKAVPTPEAVRLDSFLVDDAVKWALEAPGIVWYSMSEFALWMKERALELYGVDLPVYGEGSGTAILKEDGSRSCIASIKSHGRGRDKLQYRYHRQLLAQSPASARMHQQVQGRLHRRGQEKEAVITYLYLHTEELQDSFNQALRRGEYVLGTMGESQKLLEGWQAGEQAGG